MAYATLSHVSVRNPERVFSVSTKPSTSDVLTYIEEAAAIIDTILLNRGVALPLVDPATPGGVASAAWVMLRNANAVGAWYMAEWAAQASDKRSESEDMWQSAQKMLASSQLPLPMDPNESNARGPRGDCASPFFTRDMVL